MQRVQVMWDFKGQGDKFGFYSKSDEKPLDDID